MSKEGNFGGQDFRSLYEHYLALKQSAETSEVSSPQLEVVMAEKLRYADLSPAARTLLIPLTFRAIESRRPDAILRDARAVDLVNQFDEDSLQFAKMIDMDHICTMMRGRQFDRYAQAFLAQQPAGVVVDLGCGLDTRFDRVDNGQVTWVGVDFPEVIELRQRLLPAGPRCHLIARSALDFAWMDVVAGLNYPVIFLAEGFSTYLTEAEMKRMVLTLAERFPGSELIFDVVSPLSIWVHKFSPAIRKAQVQLHWGTNDPRTLETWKPGLHLLEVWGYFDQNEPRLGKYSWMRHVPLFANMNRILRYQLDNTPLPPGEGQG